QHQIRSDLTGHPASSIERSTLDACSFEVPGRGLEPLRISPPDPKSGASANFATLAWGNVFLSAQILAQSGNSADRSRGQELSRVRLKNFYRNTKPFRRTGALPESAHLNYRFFHQRFVHPGDAKPNNRIREECRLHRFGHAAAKFRHIENMPDFQPNMRQPAEIRVAVKRHLFDALLRTDHPDELIGERIIEQSARMPCEQAPFRIIAGVGKCLQKSSQRFLIHWKSILRCAVRSARVRIYGCGNAVWCDWFLVFCPRVDVL